MKKNIITILLTMTLGMVLLTGCGGTTEVEKTEGSVVSIEQNATGSSAVQEDLMADVQTIINETEGVKYESDNVAIEISGIDYTHYSGAAVTVTCQNKTDKKLCVDCDDLVWINGFQTWGGVDFILEAGEKKETTCTIMKAGFEEVQLSNIGEIIFYYQLRYDDEKDFFEKVKAGYRTEHYAEMDTEVGNNPKVLYQKEDLLIKAEFVKEGVWKNCLMLYMENTGEADLAVRGKDMIVTSGANSIDAGSFAYYIYAGGKSVYYAPFYTSKGEVYNVGDKINMTIEVIDPVTFANVFESEAANEITIQ